MTLNRGQDYWSCGYCGNIAVPNTNDEGVRVLEQPAPEQCPLCHVALVHAAIEKERILYCVRCHGMLVPMSIFAGLVQELRSQRPATTEDFFPPDAAALRQRIQCPRCGREMDTHVYEGGGNVVISDCERCEVNWVPHGGLERIVRAPDYRSTISL